MKNLIFSLLLLPVFAFAQQEPNIVDKKIVCVEIDVLMKELKKNEYNEIPFWMGTDTESYWTLIANKDTGTWTIIQFNEEVGCMIGAGENHGTMLESAR